VTNELLAKIARILETREPTESDVHHLFGLARKLIDSLPQERQTDFSFLRFYCNWTAHPEIDQSAEGAMIVEKMNALISGHMKRDNASEIPDELTAALSLDETRIQLQELIRTFDPEPVLIIDRACWRPIVNQLLEIVSHCPLKIDAKRKWLEPIRERIEATPIKGRVVVEQVAIVKVPSTTFDPKAAPNDFIFFTELTLSNTTRIRAPVQNV